MLKARITPQVHSLLSANRHTCKTLLNCYIRECCGEQTNRFSVDREWMTYSVIFAASGVTVSGKLSYYSAMGEHEYDSITIGHGQELEYEELVQFITAELRQQHPAIANERAADFRNKVANSYRNLALFLEHASDEPMRDYRSSEQSLLYGHPFHPFPKNKLGFTEEEGAAYSPELRVSFQLCYWAVRKDRYQEEWITEDRRTVPHEQVEEHAQRVLLGRRDRYELLPMHPWQYSHVQHIEAVQDAVRRELLIPLGRCGPLAWPTSSVRTVYIPDMGCNVKLPLNIQITNMTRNNNEEQMRRTMDAARYLWQRGCLDDEPSTAISYEEGVCTCRFGDDEVTKLFTVAYRSVAFDAGSTYVLSSLVEAPGEGAPARLFDLAHCGEMESWFKRYLDISLLPIVRTVQKQGIHFEAHLQNTLLTIRDGMPHTFIIRDLEGVSVDRGKADGNADTAGPLFYRKEEAWARTDYYFIVNHLGSLIHAIARDMGTEEEHYWAIARDLLKQEYETSGNEYVHHLLTAEAFYAKSNLLSCLAGNSEKPTYIAVRNMISQGVTLSSAQRS